MMIMDMGGAIKGIVDGIEADLAASKALAGSSAAAAGQFEVDLAALYKHHADVLKVYDDLRDKMQKIAQGQAANSCYATSDIAGVAKSFSATMDTAVSGSEGSMIGGFMAILGQIQRYADAVAGVYRSYVKADSTGSSDLTAAGNSMASKVGLPTSG